MTLLEFRELYDNAPLDPESFAEQAGKVTDCDDLSSAADAYLRALEHFRLALDHAEVAMG